MKEVRQMKETCSAGEEIHCKKREIIVTIIRREQKSTSGTSKIG